MPDQEKICFLDVETTGLNPNKNGIIQLGAFLQIDGEQVAQISHKIKPFPGDEIADKALETTGYGLDEIFKSPFRDSGVVYNEFTGELEQYIDKYDSSDKFHFVAYNAHFDSDFIRQWFKKNDDPYYGSYFFYPPLDLMQLVALRYMKHRSKFKNYKLMTVCKALGMDVKEEEAHDALYDIECTKKLFNALRDMINWNK